MTGAAMTWAPINSANGITHQATCPTQSASVARSIAIPSRAKIAGQPAEARLAARQNCAVPILDALHDWLTAQRRRLSSKNALARAMQYALGRWEALMRYAGDGRLAIDNNVAERALRTIAITRKNFLFLGSEAGGERAAILYTVLESAKLNGLDPEAYLADVIDRMAKGHPINRLGELLPWNWQRQAAKMAA